MSRPACEVADVFRRYGAAFQAQYGRLLGPLHLLVLKALAACRTAPQPQCSDEESSDPSPGGSEQASDERCPHCHKGLMRIVDVAPRPRLSEILKLPLLAPT
jgi:hypothetical protein